MKPKGRLLPWICCLTLPLLHACAGNSLATSDSETMQWKNYESRMQGKVISFEFPAEIKDTNSYEFNSSMPPPRFNGDPRNEIRVIVLQVGLDVGWVHVSKKLGIGIYLVRKQEKVLPRNTMRIGQNDWKLSIHAGGVDKDLLDESYLTEMTSDYDLLFWISADKVSEAQREKFKRITQRIIGSIKIQDD